MIAAPAFAKPRKCPPDAVPAGSTCVDRYEESVWQVPPTNKAVVAKITAGTITLAELTTAGATQLAPATSCTAPTDYGAGFPASGNWTPEPGSNPLSPGVYAVSIAGVLPSTCITWFQANQACALSGKRLVRNAEWQLAAEGTPADTGDCEQFAPAVNTGSKSTCQSRAGAFDMVGNVGELVEEWAGAPSDNPCTSWTTLTDFAGDDSSCIGGTGNLGSSAALALPHGMVRGGSFMNGRHDGVFTLFTDTVVSGAGSHIGFRCAR